MAKRSSFDVLLGIAVLAVVVFGWLTMVRVIWIAEPSKSANLNPSLPVNCSSEMLFNCTMEAERTFWNYNTDSEGAFYTQGIAAVAMIILLIVSVGMSQIILMLDARLVQKFAFTNPWPTHEIRNSPTRKLYVADDPQHEVTPKNS